MATSLSNRDDIYIICSEISLSEDDANVILKKCGFRPLFVSRSAFTGKLNLITKLSAKLMVLLAIQNNIPVKTLRNFNSLERYTLGHASLAHFAKSQESLQCKEFWIVHHQDDLKLVLANQKDSTNILSDYFGPGIAIYFAWLSFYTSYLVLPSVLGVLLFLQQIQGSVDSPYLPMFCTLLAIWTTIFLEHWKSRKAEMQYVWGVTEAEHLERCLELSLHNPLKKKEKIEAGGGRDIQMASTMHIARNVTSCGCLILTLYVMCWIQIVPFHIQYTSFKTNSLYSWMRYAPMVVFAILPSILCFAAQPISRLLTALEQHTLSVDRENFYVCKLFALNFVCRNFGMWFAAFWMRDLDNLCGQLVCSLVMNAVLNNCYELSGPMWSRLGQLLYRSQSGPVTGKLLLDPDEKSLDDWHAIVKHELALGVYDIHEDYLEMVLQFAQVTMFAAAFPLAPALAYLNNLFEGKVDLLKISSCRRPNYFPKASLGAWQHCLEAVGFISVISNCFLLCMVSNNLKIITPEFLHPVLNTTHGDLIAMIVLEHILIGIKVLMMCCVNHCPKHIQEKLAQDYLESRVETAHMRLKTYKLAASDSSSNESFAERQEDGQYIVVNSNISSRLKSINSDCQQEALVKRNAASLKIEKHLSTGFGLNPMTVCAVTLVPTALQYLRLPLALYFPISVMFFSYLQAEKEFVDSCAATNIIGDPEILKQVLHNLPSWTMDPEYQRVDWLNEILEKLWFYLQSLIEPTIKSSLQYQLDYICKPPIAPANAASAGVDIAAETPTVDSPVNQTDSNNSILKCLIIEKFSLGGVPIKIVGIRFLRTSESVVRFDVEIAWASNCNVLLKAVTTPLAALFELTNLRLSAVLRIELSNFTIESPCFEDYSIACLKPPEIDFELTASSINLMNLGTFGVSIAQLVRRQLQSLLGSLMVYPNKMTFPTDWSKPTKALITRQPDCLLNLTIQKCVNLRRVDTFSSDPYVTIRVKGDNSGPDAPLKTTVKYKCLNPVWDESFQVLIVDKQADVLELVVRDWDSFGNDTDMGNLCIPIRDMLLNKKVSFEGALQHAIGPSQGRLFVSCRLFPVASEQNSLHNRDLMQLDAAICNISDIDMEEVMYLKLQQQPSLELADKSVSSLPSSAVQLSISTDLSEGASLKHVASSAVSAASNVMRKIAGMTDAITINLDSPFGNMGSSLPSFPFGSPQSVDSSTRQQQPLLKRISSVESRNSVYGITDLILTNIRCQLPKHMIFTSGPVKAQFVGKFENSTQKSEIVTGNGELRFNQMMAFTFRYSQEQEIPPLRLRVFENFGLFGSLTRSVALSINLSEEIELWTTHTVEKRYALPLSDSSTADVAASSCYLAFTMEKRTGPVSTR